MILKVVVIVVSIVAIVLASVIVGGVIIIGQILENDPNIRNEIRQSLEREESEQDSQEESPLLSITEEEEVVSIVANSGSNSYNPNPIEIKVGDTVTWINDDSSRHTVTSSNDSTFDSDIMRRGERFSFTFDNVGEYPYFCTLHPSMVGTVIVTTSQGE
ncbi:MAG: cupredoxin family copper-binding protein [Thermoproteota archaeon]|nr:cupredoxin family copper-binding protein [Thermoproteota archaeon]